MDTGELLKKIDTYRNILEHSKVKESLDSLREYYRLNLTYTSNALEGNTLTLSETKLAIEDGLTVSGKPLKDYYEADGHAKAFDFMYELAQGKGSVVTVENICCIHRLFYEKVDTTAAGIFKTERNYISGSEHIPTAPEQVADEMRKLQLWAERENGAYHPVEFAALIHKKIVDIHPFQDGNGRTARLVMNLCLLNKGYLLISIPPVLRMEYIAALEQSRGGTAEPFIKFIAECEMESLRDRFRMLEIPFPKLSESQD